MSSLIVEVCKIDEVIKHSNADKLSIATVKGWNCIIGLDQYKVGDTVVFIPPDCIIPNDLIEKYELVYLRNGGRTGTLKLRGYISQGLILPLSVFENYGTLSYNKKKQLWELEM
jgi:RNA ligase (TIGR02306 family)